MVLYNTLLIFPITQVHKVFNLSYTCCLICRISCKRCESPLHRCVGNPFFCAHPVRVRKPDLMIKSRRVWRCIHGQGSPSSFCKNQLPQTVHQLCSDPLFVVLTVHKQKRNVIDAPHGCHANHLLTAKSCHDRVFSYHMQLL